jgi:hypothetical protein|tara:strand:- start:4596 stop:4745 length:150 start_codon:yes stop_codon:yes gene_type:complete
MEFWYFGGYLILWVVVVVLLIRMARQHIRFMSYFESLAAVLRYYGLDRL